MKKRNEQILASVVLLFFFSIFLWAISKSWSNWVINNELNSRGISTIATITKCNSGQKNTPLTFRFTVINSAEIEETYVVTHSGGGGTAAKCKKGKSIRIRYLPESPESARHSSSSEVSVHVVIALCSLAILVGLVKAMIKENLFTQ